MTKLINEDLLPILPSRELDNIKDELVICAEDTAHISLYVNWDKKKLQPLLAELFQLQREAQEARNEITYIYLDEQEYKVYPHGISPAKNKYGYYQFVIESEGIKYAIKPKEKDEKQPNIRIEVSSLALIWANGLYGLWDGIKARVESWGCKIDKNRLARVDACIDLVSEKVSDLQEAYYSDKWISRAKAASTFDIYLGDTKDAQICAETNRKGRKETGLRIGRSPIQMRAYDKLEECKNDPVKLEAMKLKRWGYTPNFATRIEFELKREALRGFWMKVKPNGIETVEDWFMFRGDIINYLMTHWLKFIKTEKKINRNHTERLEDDDMLDVWKKARDQFIYWFGLRNELVRRPTKNEKTIKVKAQPMVVQAIGCLQTAFARCNHTIDDIDEFIADATHALKCCIIDENDFWEKWNEKQLRISGRVPHELIDSIMPFYGEHEKIPLDFSFEQEKTEICGAGVTHGQPEKFYNGKNQSGNPLCPLPSSRSGARIPL